MFPIIFFLLLKQVTCLVCNETISVLREVPETYRYTYFEAYEDEECVLCWTKSRQAVNLRTKLVTKLVNETILTCCDGYTKDLSYIGNGLQCVAMCNPPCMNGYCRTPNECACEWGFASDPSVPNICRPLCLEGCTIPDCLSTCNIDHGVIEPDTCPEPCENGTCVTGLCQCQPGYHLSKQNTCEPTCSSCDHGTCVAPDVCECKPGWSEECGSCRPVCTGCDHGTCTSPDQCECEAGYEARAGKCEPVCSKCNGNCIGPDVCVCSPGWYMNEGLTECMAHCDAPCENGTCVAPNVCDCYPGYKTNAPGSQCIPVCDNCDGICTGPGVCECGAEYDTVYTTADGGECDCFECSAAKNKCDRITCRNFTHTVEDVMNSSTYTATNERPTDGMPAGFLNGTFSNYSRTDNSYPPIRIKTLEVTYHWIYGAIIIVELLLIILLVAINKRKHILNRLKTKMFVPKDTHNDEVAVHYTTNTLCVQ